ncbi:hypothetical protein ES702_01994 [subsurface metagenome]
MKTKTKTTEQKEIGRIALSDEQDLVASIIDKEKLDLRVYMSSDSYRGPTKRGVRFYMFDENWPAFKRLIDKIDKEYQQL